MIHSRSLSRTSFSCASFSAYSSLSSGGTSTFMKNAPANPGSCLLSPTPHAVWHTRRRTPCSFIAAMMFAEPAEDADHRLVGSYRLTHLTRVEGVSDDDP